MKPCTHLTKPWRELILGLLGLIPLNLMFAQQPTSPTALASNDELAVYAAVLDSPRLGSSSRPLIADTTSTFACASTICNGLSIGGCNGLRTANETPSERLAIVKRDIPELQETTVSSFEKQNQKCSPVGHDIPTAIGYHLFSDSDIPKEWHYSFLVYLSRVGFNAQHTQALVNIGLMSATNAKDSNGEYLILNKKSGKWRLGESSAVWELEP